LSAKKKWLCKPKRPDARRTRHTLEKEDETEIMKNLDRETICRILNTIIEYEMAGVVRYAHSSLMVIGPYRQPIVQFLQDQATESLQHALEAGELITGLDGHPSQKIADIEESNDHSVTQILSESLAHEEHAVTLYRSLLDAVSDTSVMLEEYARGKISAEEQHALEVKKMLKDYTPAP
jgi:bacterioferritin